MNKEKQIEEMAKILCGMKNGCDGCMWDKVHCNERNYVAEIYNAGYRKASEVAREIIDDCIEILNREYRKHDTNEVKIILAMINTITELKKKYTEEGK